MEQTRKTKVFGWFLLLGITCLYFFSNLQKTIVPGAMFNELQVHFGVDATMITGIGAAFVYSYAIGQLLAGALADRYCGARVIAIGGILFSAGALLSACCGNLTMLMVSRALTGLGAATIYLCAVKEINRIAPDMFAMLMGILLLLGYSGSLTGQKPFMWGVREIGFERMLLWGGIGTLVAYVIFLCLYVPSSLPPIQKEASFSLNSYLAVFKRRHNIYQIGMCAIGFGTYFAFQTVIGKKFLQDYCRMEVENAEIVLTVTALIAAVNGFIVANLSRLWGNRRRPFLWFEGFGCLTTALALFILVLTDCRSGVLASCILIFQAFAGNVGPMTSALFREANEEYRLGTVMSVSNFFAYIVPALFGGFAGPLMDLFEPEMIDGARIYGRNSYLVVFAVFLGLGVLAAFFACFLKESFGKNIAKELK